MQLESNWKHLFSTYHFFADHKHGKQSLLEANDCAFVFASTDFKETSAHSYEYFASGWTFTENKEQSGSSGEGSGKYDDKKVPPRKNYLWKCVVAANESKQHSKRHCCFLKSKEDHCAIHRTTSNCSTSVETMGYLPYYLVAGTLGLLGNAAVIWCTTRLLLAKFESLSSVQRIHNFLLLNLAVSDFLMGLYLCTIAIILTFCANKAGDEDKCEIRALQACNGLGIINFVSTQVSVTSLVIMTSYRLYSVMRPYKVSKISLRLTGLYVFACWALWVAIAFVPLSNNALLKLKFVKSARLEVPYRTSEVHRHYDKVPYGRLKKTVSNILSIANEFCSANITLSKTPSWNELLDMAKQFKLYQDEVLYGFYNKQVLCSMKYMVDGNDDSVSFTLTILTYNFIAFLFVALSYCVVVFQTSSRGCWFYKHCNSWRWCNCSSVSGNEAVCVAAGNAQNESRKMHRLIAAIVITDSICWVPLCILAFWHAAYTVRLNKQDTPCFWTLTKKLNLVALLFVPLNSCVNPMLYSARLRVFFKNLFAKIHPHWWILHVPLKTLI